MSDSFVDKLAFWRKEQKLGATDEVIDPAQEADRLSAARSGTDAPAPSASSPFDGTPTIEKTKVQSSSWFGWVGNMILNDPAPGPPAPSRLGTNRPPEGA